PSPRTSPPEFSDSRTITSCSRRLRRRRSRQRSIFPAQNRRCVGLWVRRDPQIVPTLHLFPSSKLVPVDDVVLATQGDTAAFERVYRAHMPLIFNLPGRVAGADA